MNSIIIFLVVIFLCGINDVFYLHFKEKSFMSKLIEKINKEQIRTDIPEFRVGDTVRVGVKIKEGKKERVQNFEGIVFNITGGSVSKTFTVRRKVGAVGVERVFPVNSPLIDSITVVKKGKVRRSKLTFLRGMKKDFKTKERN